MLDYSISFGISLWPEINALFKKSPVKPMIMGSNQADLFLMTMGFSTQNNQTGVVETEIPFSPKSLSK